MVESYRTLLWWEIKVRSNLFDKRVGYIFIDINIKYTLLSVKVCICVVTLACHFSQLTWNI